MIIHDNKCPCFDCRFYAHGKQHPNSYDSHYCEKKKKAIRQHNGNLYHYKGQWILPCNGYSYEEK